MSTTRLLLSLAAVAGCAGGAVAERLDKQACDGLREEQARLVASGTRRDMENGPEWAKVHLGESQLARIAKLMGVDEQLIFRCETLRPQRSAATDETAPPTPRRKVKSAHKPAPDGAQPAKSHKAKAAAAHDSSEGAKHAAKAHKPARTADTGTQADGAGERAGTKPAAARTKPNDAYVPKAADADAAD